MTCALSPERSPVTNTETLDNAPTEVAPTRFDQLPLGRTSLATAAALGFEEATPIQSEAIPVLVSGRDVVGIAQTGTGKTAAFGFPLLELVDPNVPAVQALVLSPTRELALQTAQALTDFSAGTKVGVVAVYGGASYVPQLRALRGGAQVVVGTPGRIIDLLERKSALDLQQVKVFILDEADEMLRMGFAEDVEKISSYIPEERLTALFSATMPPAISRVAENHLREPVRVEVSQAASTVDTIHQTYAIVPPRHRFTALTRVLAVREGQATIVFVRTRQDAEEIALDLAGEGFKAAGISGDVPQIDRERLVERLRSGTLDVLVATDVAARGLDVERVGLVVNYDVPREKEAYVHRIGRTGRAGREGESLIFFGPRDRHELRQIERLTGGRLEEVQIPSPAEVTGFLARRQLEQLPALPSEAEVGILQEAISAQLREGLSLPDLTLRLLASQTQIASPAVPSGGRETDAEVDTEGRFLRAEFAEPGKKRRSGKPRENRFRAGTRNPDKQFNHRYRVEVGRRDGVTPGAIVGAIVGEGGLSGADVGHINIFPSFSLVELGFDLSPSQVQRIGKAKVRGRKLRIAADTGEPPRKRAGRARGGR